MDALIDIREADPGVPGVADLIRTHIDFGDAHYPADSNHHLGVEGYADDDGTLWAAFDGAACVGMIGLKVLDGQNGELKSMHVLPAARVTLFAYRLVDQVKTEATAKGLSTLWLETGSREASAAARKLYERHGFTICPPFAHYELDPESVFMTLPL